MSLTLPNIPIPTGEWIDLYFESKISIGTKVFIDNVGSSDIYYSSSQNQPPLDFRSYNTLKPRSGKITNKDGDEGLWALALVDGTEVNVSKFKPETNQNPMTAFGDVKVESMTPITQISAEYGLLNQVLTVIDSSASGTVSVVNNKFTCQSGTASDGLSSILSLRQLKYRPGQGALGRFTAVFDDPVADNQQLAGLITAENIFAFGYLGTSFGIIYAHDGESENQELTITNPASGSESATITIDGTPFSVSLTVGSVQHNAFEIAISLTAQVPNYSFSSNNDQVVAQALISGAQGSFLFNSPTAVAVWFQETVGLAPVVDFTPQTLWNVDTRISSLTKSNLEPQSGNVYQVQYQYLGFGAIKFFIEDSVSGEFVLVHTIQFANSSTLTSVTNPTFRIGWFVRNIGNTSNITVSGSSAGAFIEGIIKRSTPPRAEGNDQPVPALGVFTNIITFRNRTHFGGKVNRAEIFPLIATASTQTNKFAFFRIIANPIFSGDLNFSYIDKTSSLMEIAKDAVIVTGGIVVGEITVVAGSSASLLFNERIDLDFIALPGVTFSISASIPTGAASDCQATGTWQEDL